VISRPRRPNPEEASIYRLVHRDNLSWILDNGMHCASSTVRDPGYVSIGKDDLIVRRALRKVPSFPGGTLADCVPFYFTPFSPMLLNIVTGRGVSRREDAELLVLASRLWAAQAAGVSFVLTDRHAYSKLAVYRAGVDGLNAIDWALLQRRDFSRDPEDPEKQDRYQAEALLHRHLPVEALIGIICCTESVGRRVRREVEVRGLRLEISVRERGYFS